jgi:hypothetical protein
MAKLCFQQSDLQAVTLAGALHHRLAGRVAATHQQRGTNHALMADQADFGRRIVLEDSQQRHRRGGRKVDILQLATGFAQDFSELHRDQFHMGGDAFEYVRRQGG